jgi:uncharacterized protein
MELLGYISLFLVGLILGTLGGGGSILSVPILVYLFALDTVIASAYSLFVVGSTSLVGSILKHKAQLISFRTGFTFGIPSILAIFCMRKWIIPSIPDIVLQVGLVPLTKRTLILIIFAFLMILASILMIRRKNKLTNIRHEPRHLSFLILLGLFTGFLSGLVGVGGGFIIIPVLIYFTDLPFKTAVGTTLLIIASNSLIGFAGDMMNYTLNWKFLFTITGLAILGICIGSKFTMSLPASRLQKSLGWLTLMIGVWILVREVFLCSGI